MSVNLRISSSRIYLMAFLVTLLSKNIASQDPPRADPGAPRNFLAIVNQEITLPCPFSDRDKFFRWETDTRQYIKTRKQTYTYIAPSTPQLNVFYCIAINGFGKVTETLNVRVVDPDSPIFKRECASILSASPDTIGPCFLKQFTPEDLRVIGVQGGSTELNCEAVATGPVVYSWQAILSGPDGTKGSAQAHELPSGPLLRLDKLTADKSGEYRCVAIGPGNQRIRRSFKVSVKESGLQLIVGQRTQNISVAIEGNVKLNCKTTKEYGIPVVKWSKRIEPFLKAQYEDSGHSVIASARGFFLLLPNSRMFNETTSEGTFFHSNLEISGVSPEDAGEYLCTAFTNSGLSDKRVVNLYVDSKGASSQQRSNLIIFVLVGLTCGLLLVALVVFFMVRHQQKTRAGAPNGTSSGPSGGQHRQPYPSVPYYPGQQVSGGGVKNGKNGGGGSGGSGNNNSSTHASSFAMEPHGGGGMHHSDTPSPPTTMQFYPPSSYPTSNHYTPPINSQPPTNGYNNYHP